MRIEELNKENALSVKNNLDIESYEEVDWIENSFEFYPSILYESRNIKIYQGSRGEHLFIITDSDDNILS